MWWDKNHIRKYTPRQNISKGVNNFVFLPNTTSTLFVAHTLFMYINDLSSNVKVNVINDKTIKYENAAKKR